MYSLVSSMLLVVLCMARHECFHMTKVLFSTCLVFRVYYVNSMVIYEISQCRVTRLAHSMSSHICIFSKTSNPKNNYFSDKSGLYRVMHETFNNVFDTTMCGTFHGLHGGVIICFMDHCLVYKSCF